MSLESLAERATRLSSLTTLLLSGLPLAFPFYEVGQSMVELLHPCPRPLGERRMLVEFFAPWCAHCKQMAPVYDELAVLASVEPELKGLRLGAVDCTLKENEGCCADFDIKKYPTIYLLGGRDGKLEYIGSKTVANMRPWLEANREMWLGRPESGVGLRDEEVETSDPPRWVDRSGPAADIPTVIAGARLTLMQVVPSALSSHHAGSVDLDEHGLLQLMQGDSSHKTDDSADDPALPDASDVFLPSMAGARRLRRVLLNWLLVLQLGLPREFDDGKVVGAVLQLRRWLLTEVLGIPTEKEWLHAATYAGVDTWPSASPACSSSNEVMASNCSLWVLFHCMASHTTEALAVGTADAIAAYMTAFHTGLDIQSLKSIPTAARDGKADGLPRDNAVLWLWKVHNEVNVRLAVAQAELRSVSSCLLSITDNRGSQDLQLAEVRLYGLNGSLLAIRSAAVHHDPEDRLCHSPTGEGTMNAVDGRVETKWLCRAKAAELHLLLSAPAIVSSYELVSANDFPDRDPTRWTFKCRAGRSHPFAAMHSAQRQHTNARKTSFGMVELVPQHHRFGSQKREWPPPDACPGCHASSSLSRKGHRLTHSTTQHGHGRWHHSAIVSFLHRTYCLESCFECWNERDGLKQRWQLLPGMRVIMFVVVSVMSSSLLWVCFVAWSRDQQDLRRGARLKQKTAENMA